MPRPTYKVGDLVQLCPAHRRSTMQIFVDSDKQGRVVEVQDLNADLQYLVMQHTDRHGNAVSTLDGTMWTALNTNVTTYKEV